MLVQLFTSVDKAGHVNQARNLIVKALGAARKGKKEKRVRQKRAK